MFRKFIVVSESARLDFDVLKRLKGLSKLGAKECLLLGCISKGDTSDQNLGRQKDILSEQGYAVETRVIHDSFIDEINRIAAEEAFSLVVTAAEDHAVEGEAVSGGFAHELPNRAQLPVLLVRTSDDADQTLNGSEEYGLTDRILFTTDFSANANTAFERLKELVGSGIRKISLVHVQDIARINADISERLYLGQFNYTDTQKEIAKLRLFAVERLRKYDEDDTQRLNEMKRQLQELGDVEVDTQLLYGPPAVRINEFASDKKISLVVIGGQGRDSIIGLFLGSVSNDVARESSASVLVVPPLTGKR